MSVVAPLPKRSKVAAECPAQRATELAEKLLRQSLAVRTSPEKNEMNKIAGLVNDPESKRLSMAMTDRMWRSRSAHRTAAGFRSLLNRAGRLPGFSRLDRAMLRLASFGSRFMPALVIGEIRKRMKRESARVILPAEDPELADYLSQEKERTGVRTNINQLGEAVLGEREAESRLKRIIALLERQDVNYVSVKLSAIYSQISLVAWEHTLDQLRAKLRRLYRVALSHGKFVNLDMEEYRDLELTATAFQQVLTEPEFMALTAGIVLQAYLPDSLRVQRELTEWAQHRCQNGGAPVKIRLVKGANLAMEKVDAEWHGWNQAPHLTKSETDACFKRMLEFALTPERSQALRLGVGSHNLFDVALALTLARDRGVEPMLDMEMLEGMAPAQARVVAAETGRLLVYAPIVDQDDFGSALAYLVRRLDENTSPGNFLADLFDLAPDSNAWGEQRDRFLAAWERRGDIGEQSRRSHLPTRVSGTFTSAPDTDWTQRPHREGLYRALAGQRRPELPPVSGVEEIRSALELLANGHGTWASSKERKALLLDCANRLAEERFMTVALLNDEGKKAVTEADTEVSEAIDFARYYAEMAQTPEGMVAQPLGTVVIAPPWNFPYAIPCGGVVAALAAGNTVLLKPAPEAVSIGWHLANQLWSAGVPQRVLQLVFCEDGETGKRLITNHRTNAVVLTGSYETAQRFQSWRPTLPLFAETSGKNAILVSALADRELAARDLVRSAFGHSGQKCSAASLGILEPEVYDDPVFRRQLGDAAASLRVGPARDLASVVTPLVQNPGKELHRALTTLEQGEEWLLQPAQQDCGDERLWSPGIKLGVKPGSWFHQTECFGPVLGLMRASDLSEGLAFQNAVRFGLTAGFHSLDEGEIAWWKERVEAGNLYINRGTTGAIVQRQPFGGWKESNVGPGAKAGGPNYVNLFRTLRDRQPASVECALASYRAAWQSHFSVSADPCGLKCESNVFRYRPKKGVLLRLPRNADARVEQLAKSASAVTGVALVISREASEPVATLIERLAQDFPRGTALRTIGENLEEDLLRAAARADMKWIDAPFCSVGRIELTRWLDEQTVSETRHRYGNPF